MKLQIRLLACVATLVSANAHADVFNGPYAGGVVGYDKLSAKASTGGVSGSTSGDSVSGGLVGGYNAKLSDQFVIGAEIEGTIGGGKLTDGDDELKTDYRANAGIRAGFLVSNKALIYAKAAYARSQLSFDGESESGDGLAFGGGVEVAFSPNVSGRIAYTRTSYSVDDEAEADLGADVDITRDQVMAGVAFHF